MFKKNTAVVGFPIGNFINASTGATVTTGTPVETRLIDGTGSALTNAATYNTDAAQWEIDLEAADMNGDMIGLSFALTDCLPISYTIKTVLGVPQSTIAATDDLSGLATSAELAKVPKSDSNITFNATALASINAQCDIAISDAALATAAVCTEARLSELDAGTAGKMANQVDEIRTDTEDIQTKIGTPVGASVSVDIAAVKSDSADILVDTGTTLDTLIKDIPTVAEFEARTIPSVDYFDPAADTVATVTTVTNMLTAAAVKTSMEADNSDLDYLVTDLINKKEITIADGATKQYNDAGNLIGTIAAAYSDDGTTVTRKAMRQVK